MVKYLFNYLENITQMLNKADKVLLFLDYDGTLAPFKNRPNDVITSNKVRNVIQRLLKVQKYKVIIVTGRRLIDIKQLLNLEGISYAALHGMNIALDNGNTHNWKPDKDIRPILNQIKSIVMDEFSEEKDIFLENKEYSLAFHYRMVKTDNTNAYIQKFLNIVKTVDTDRCLNILKGSKVIEIRPKGWHKGKSVEFILKLFSEQINILPVYIGDDITDEDAFRSIGNEGITIYVSNNSKQLTTARYYLKNPHEVLNFLDLL
jgi:trehalose-phosphatase